MRRVAARVRRAVATGLDKPIVATVDRPLLGLEAFLLSGYPVEAGAEDTDAFLAEVAGQVCSAPVLCTIMLGVLFAMPWRDALRDDVVEALACLGSDAA